jgi:hypothetical protein
VGKIIDVKNETISSTKLKSVVAAIAGAAGMPFSDVTYYDFRYPNATNMMFIAENYDGGDNDFTVELTSAFGYPELSWALYNIVSAGYFRLDGTDKVSSATYWDGSTGFGYLDASELLPDTTYTIEVDDYGVLIIVYRVP